MNLEACKTICFGNGICVDIETMGSLLLFLSESEFKKYDKKNQFGPGCQTNAGMGRSLTEAQQLKPLRKKLLHKSEMAAFTANTLQIHK